MACNSVRLFNLKYSSQVALRWLLSQKALHSSVVTVSFFKSFAHVSNLSFLSDRFPKRHTLQRRERKVRFKWMKRNFPFCSLQFMIKNNLNPWNNRTKGCGYTAASKQQVSIKTITAHTQPLHVDSVTPIINYCVSVVIKKSKAQPWPQPWQQAELWHPVVSQVNWNCLLCIKLFQLFTSAVKSIRYYSWNHKTVQSSVFPADQRKHKRFPTKHKNKKKSMRLNKVWHVNAPNSHKQYTTLH